MFINFFGFYSLKESIHLQLNLDMTFAPTCGVLASRSYAFFIFFSIDVQICALIFIHSSSSSSFSIHSYQVMKSYCSGSWYDFSVFQFHVVVDIYWIVVF